MKTVDTGYCVWCGKPSAIEVQNDEIRSIKEWLELRRTSPENAPFIQDKLFFLSPDQRETILTGVHSKCFDEGFGNDDDE